MGLNLYLYTQNKQTQVPQKMVYKLAEGGLWCNPPTPVPKSSRTVETGEAITGSLENPCLFQFRHPGISLRLVAPTCLN